MNTPDKPTAPPDAAWPFRWHPDTEARQHLIALVIAVVLPVLIRLLSDGVVAGGGLFSFLAVVSGFALVATGLLLYAWWMHTAWVNRDGESWNQRWMLGQGPTAFSRHPQWVAVIALTLGQALITRSIVLCAYALLVLVAMNLLVRRHDEPHLARRHGADYHAYAQRVARWLPWTSVGRTLREIGQLLRNSVR